MTRLSEIRKGSLVGVRDLTSRCKDSGILITGREHYFNSDEEMFECLGLDSRDVVILRCPEEFTGEELEAYVSARVKVTSFPSWLPKKPLLCQLLTRLENNDLTEIIQSDYGEITFFEKILEAICDREAKIHPTIFKDTLRNILLDLATVSRVKVGNLGPVTPREISASFEKVTGSVPIDESAIVLQRLPYLGRAGSGTGDRVFIDYYAVDGLRALSLVQNYFEKNGEIKHQKWVNTLGAFGQKIIGNKICMTEESVKYFRTLEVNGNPVPCCDFVAGAISENMSVDFGNLPVSNGNFSVLDFSGKKVANLFISESTVDEIHLDDYIFKNVSFNECHFGKVYGGSGDKVLDDKFFQNCSVDEYENLQTISNISQIGASNGQKTLLSIIKKLFFQPGRARKEEALLRGAERYWDKPAAEKVLHYMLTNGIVEKFKGDTGMVYKPNRSYAARMKLMMEEMANSNDDLWDLLGS